MLDQIEDTARRAKRYWYDDGLTELATGAIFLLVAGLFGAEQGLAAGAPISAVGLPVVVIGGTWLSSRVVQSLKARFTYTRTGYVAYRRPARPRRILSVLAGLAIAAVVVWAFAQADQAWIDLIPVLDGIAIGAGFLYIGVALGLVRFVALALASLAAGVGATQLVQGVTLGSAVYFAIVGVALLVSGTVALRRYMGSSMHEQPNAEVAGS